ncbi:MAG TPA: penicillin-binding protein 2 [Steroidobacteraceae bacterium]|nr:penicillin-binding protein 2 [Steroidobacteraceae bacterium]
MDSRVRIKDHWNEQRIFSQRTLGAFVIIALLTITLIGRLSYLQVVRHDYYLGLSLGNRVRLDPIPASRGLIRDRNGVVLADNEPAYQLELIREQVPDLNDTLKRLSVLGLIDPDSVDDTRRMIMSRRSFDTVPVRLRLTDEEIGRFAVHRFQFPGVDLATRQTRHYPFGEMAVHALGYVAAISETDLDHIDRNAYAGTTLIGKLGVENTYETALHGKNGYREILVNAQGRSVQHEGVFAAELHSQAPTAGDDLITSIDLATQQAAEDGLGTHRGAVVAIDPNTGDVVALASKPEFDPAAFARGLTRAELATLNDDIQRPLFNRALRGTYPSGSTIKPVLGLVALTDHQLTAETRVFCNGTFNLPGSAHVWRADKDEPRGMLDMQEAIARSSDVYFYKLAAGMGIDKMDAGLAPFGYGQPTGIDISGERSGLLPTPAWKARVYKQPWFPGETVNMGIGQGYLLVTPLQLAHIAGVLAERGRSFRPRLVKSVRDADGNIKALPPVEEKPVAGISDADWSTVVDAMVHTTHCAPYCGTAWVAFKNAAYDAAGKTGTAQVYTVAQNAKYNAKTLPETLRDHAWFIAFAPAEAPKIAVAVLVENAGFGSQYAAPIARKVMDTYLLSKDPAAKDTTKDAATKDGASQ